MIKLSKEKVLQLTKDGKVRHIEGNRFDCNPEASGRIVSNKYETFEVLESQNVPSALHFPFYSPTLNPSNVDDEGNWPWITALLEKEGTIVVKSNTGSEGKDVYLCSTQKETEIAVHKLLRKRRSISICPYYDIQTEYRTFFLNGKIYLIYGKTKPYVIGDGFSTLGELVQELNLPDKKASRDNVKVLDLSYVPSVGEKFFISWKHNLSGGATPTILDKESDLYKKVEELAIKAGHAINMNFATIDIIHTTDDKLYVLEINSGVCVAVFVEKIEGGYEIAKNIYSDALDFLFQ